MNVEAETLGNEDSFVPTSTVTWDSTEWDVVGEFVTEIYSSGT